LQRLAGASLLVFANKQDIQGALKPAEIAKVPLLLACVLLVSFVKFISFFIMSRGALL
jgi:signal recognition particle receptor subunit beta